MNNHIDIEKAKKFIKNMNENSLNIWPGDERHARKVNQNRSKSVYPTKFQKRNPNYIQNVQNKRSTSSNRYFSTENSSEINKYEKNTESEVEEEEEESKETSPQTEVLKKRINNLQERWKTTRALLASQSNTNDPNCIINIPITKSI
jgi:hypothetical protein